MATQPTKHSPGPFSVEHDRGHAHILAADHVGGSATIATVYSRSNGPDADAFQLADAALFAAAPDLLSALKFCALQIAQNHGRKLTSDEQEALDWAREVIAKAQVQA